MPFKAAFKLDLFALEKMSPEVLPQVLMLTMGMIAVWS
jgi:hypothetical protein